jgi:hypothetical protein
MVLKSVNLDMTGIDGLVSLVPIYLKSINMTVEHHSPFVYFSKCAV